MSKTDWLVVVSCLTFTLQAGYLLSAGAQETANTGYVAFDPAFVETANQVMSSIYENVLPEKDHEDQLMDFDRFALHTNRYGVTEIRYRREIPDGMRKGEFLEFGVTMVGIEDRDFAGFGKNAFSYPFPLLGIKFVGYQRTNRKYMRFSIQQIVSRNVRPFAEAQNALLPLQVTLNPGKEAFHLGEDIEIMVTVKNVSPTNLWIREINEKNMYFLYTDIPWSVRKLGKTHLREKQKFVLRPGEEARETFSGSGFLIPGDHEVYGSYSVTFEGLRPFDFTKVKVIE